MTITRLTSARDTSNIKSNIRSSICIPYVLYLLPYSLPLTLPPPPVTPLPPPPHRSILGYAPEVPYIYTEPNSAMRPLAGVSHDLQTKPCSRPMGAVLGSEGKLEDLNLRKTCLW